MQRLIDANALTTAVLKKAFEDALLSGNTDMHKLLISIVAHQPTVDALPVIRCKDCKHRDEETANCTRFRRDWYVQSNSFCSWAERRGEGKCGSD